MVDTIPPPIPTIHLSMALLHQSSYHHPSRPFSSARHCCISPHTTTHPDHTPQHGIAASVPILPPIPTILLSTALLHQSPYHHPSRPYSSARHCCISPHTTTHLGHTPQHGIAASVPIPPPISAILLSTALLHQSPYHHPSLPYSSARHCCIRPHTTTHPGHTPQHGIAASVPIPPPIPTILLSTAGLHQSPYHHPSRPYSSARHCCISPHTTTHPDHTPQQALLHQSPYHHPSRPYSHPDHTPQHGIAASVPLPPPISAILPSRPFSSARHCCISPLTTTHLGHTPIPTILLSTALLHQSPYHNPSRPYSSARHCCISPHTTTHLGHTPQHGIAASVPIPPPIPAILLSTALLHQSPYHHPSRPYSSARHCCISPHTTTHPGHTPQHGIAASVPIPPPISAILLSTALLHQSPYNHPSRPYSSARHCCISPHTTTHLGHTPQHGIAASVPIPPPIPTILLSTALLSQSPYHHPSRPYSSARHCCVSPLTTTHLGHTPIPTILLSTALLHRSPYHNPSRPYSSARHCCISPHTTTHPDHTPQHGIAASVPLPPPISAILLSTALLHRSPYHHPSRPYSSARHCCISPIPPPIPTLLLSMALLHRSPYHHPSRPYSSARHCCISPHTTTHPDHTPRHGIAASVPLPPPIPTILLSTALLHQSPYHHPSRPYSSARHCCISPHTTTHPDHTPQHGIAALVPIPPPIPTILLSTALLHQSPYHHPSRPYSSVRQGCISPHTTTHPGHTPQHGIAASVPIPPPIPTILLSTALLHRSPYHHQSWPYSSARHCCISPHTTTHPDHSPQHGIAASVPIPPPIPTILLSTALLHQSPYHHPSRPYSSAWHCCISPHTTTHPGHTPQHGIAASVPIPPPIPTILLSTALLHQSPYHHPSRPYSSARHCCISPHTTTHPDHSPQHGIAASVPIPPPIPTILLGTALLHQSPYHHPSRPYSSARLCCIGPHTTTHPGHSPQHGIAASVPIPPPIPTILLSTALLHRSHTTTPPDHSPQHGIAASVPIPPPIPTILLSTALLHQSPYHHPSRLYTSARHCCISPHTTTHPGHSPQHGIAASVPIPPPIPAVHLSTALLHQSPYHHPSRPYSSARHCCISPHTTTHPGHTPQHGIAASVPIPPPIPTILLSTALLHQSPYHHPSRPYSSAWHCCIGPHTTTHPDHSPQHGIAASVPIPPPIPAVHLSTALLHQSPYYHPSRPFSSAWHCCISPHTTTHPGCTPQHGIAASVPIPPPISAILLSTALLH